MISVLFSGCGTTKTMDDRTYGHIQKVKPELAKVVRLAYSNCSTRFVVIEGLRTKERQRELYKNNKTWTLNSKHLVGKAIDIAVLDTEGRITWELEPYRKVYLCFKNASERLKTPLRAGIKWEVVDAGHYELL